MNVELLTKQDLTSLKIEIIDEIKKLLHTPVNQNQWMKSADVMKMLKCSPGTLQNLRINGTLPFSKIGGTTYYATSDVIKVLEQNKRNIS